MIDDTQFDECLSSLGGGGQPPASQAPTVGTAYYSAAHLPTGCAARDCNGGTLVCWPDGTLGYPGGPRIDRSRAGESFAPYTLLRTGMTADECAEIAAFPTRLTWQDFIDAKAAMDHAPASGWDYVLVGNKWMQEIPGFPLREVRPETFMVCMCVAQNVARKKLTKRT